MGGIYRRLSRKWSQFSVAVSSPTPHALLVYSLYSAVCYFAGAMDKFITATVYVFVGQGFDRVKGNCVNGQLATEITVFLVCTVMGVLASWWAVRKTSLPHWHLPILSVIPPFLLVVDNNLMAHCSFGTEKTRDATLITFAVTLIILGLVHLPTVVFLYIPKERELLAYHKSHRKVCAYHRELAAPTTAESTAPTSTDGPVEDSIRRREDRAERWYEKHLRAHVVTLTLTVQFALTSDHVMTGVNDIMLHRGFDPREGKCLDGQLAVEIVLLSLMTVIGVIAVALRGIKLLSLPCSPTSTVSFRRRLVHVLLAVVIIPGYSLIDNSQMIHCFHAHEESSSTLARTFAGLLYAIGVGDMVWYFTAKIPELVEEKAIPMESVV